MNKPILVITHERSGTHLLINLINYHNFGQFYTIGYIPKVKNKIYTLQEYKHQVYKDITVYSYLSDIVCKSHHQVQFMENYLDFIFDKYHVIYVKRDIKDMLLSYYRFLPGTDNDFPKIEDWVFMKPKEVGEKYLLTSDNHMVGPDPHIIVEPENYIDRWLMHIEGWTKYKDNILFINYEDILQEFPKTKLIIEEHIGRRISDKIPDINDKRFTNINPGKGIAGSHKEVMSHYLIEKIDNYIYNRR
jgi:hypothetical protein